MKARLSMSAPPPTASLRWTIEDNKPAFVNTGARPKLSKCIVTQACKDIRKLRQQKPPPAAQVQLATLRPPPPVVESRNSTTNYTADTLFAWMPMPSSHERLNFDDRFN
ncbi:Hypothetical predicted protein, partial [Cloeon dipterum]